MLPVSISLAIGEFTCFAKAYAPLRALRDYDIFAISAPLHAKAAIVLLHSCDTCRDCLTGPPRPSSGQHGLNHLLLSARLGPSIPNFRATPFPHITAHPPRRGAWRSSAFVYVLQYLLPGLSLALHSLRS